MRKKWFSAWKKKTIEKGMFPKVCQSKKENTISTGESMHLAIDKPVFFPKVRRYSVEENRQLCLQAEFYSFCYHDWFSFAANTLWQGFEKSFELWHSPWRACGSSSCVPRQCLIHALHLDVSTPRAFGENVLSLLYNEPCTFGTLGEWWKWEWTTAQLEGSKCLSN